MTCEKFARQIDPCLSGDLAAVPTLEDESIAVGGVRERQRAVFSRAGHPPIRFGSATTPVGRLFVGVTDKGVCDVTFGQDSESSYRQRLLSRSPEVWRDDTGLTLVFEQLAAYFDGHLNRFSLPVDLRALTPFTTRVLQETQKLRFGRVTSYGELARRLGAPGASRAVGGALGRNPVPIIIPCHRVIAQGGRIGGFSGGLPTKRTLLKLEGYRFVKGRGVSRVGP